MRTTIEITNEQRSKPLEAAQILAPKSLALRPRVPAHFVPAALRPGAHFTSSTSPAPALRQRPPDSRGGSRQARYHLLVEHPQAKEKPMAPDEEDDLIEAPVMLGMDSPGATTSGVDVNEVTGGFQPLPVAPGSPDVPIDVSEPNPAFFRAFCESIHPPGTPGCPPGGGLWSGDLTTDLEFARGQMRAHNEMFDSDPNHARAFVAVRIRNTFVPQPDIF